MRRVCFSSGVRVVARLSVTTDTILRGVDTTALDTLLSSFHNTDINNLLCLSTIYQLAPQHTTIITTQYLLLHLMKQTFFLRFRQKLETSTFGTFTFRLINDRIKWQKQWQCFINIFYTSILALMIVPSVRFSIQHINASIGIVSIWNNHTCILGLSNALFVVICHRQELYFGILII